MEELLNKLIEKGWKPRGKTGIDERDGFVYMNKGQCIRLHKGIQANNMLCGEYNLRELVSKESGLWQFCVENGMVKRPRGEAPEDVRVWRYVETMGIVWSRCFGKKTPEFYIIESSLKDESELEQFLLDNIKIDE